MLQVLSDSAVFWLLLMGVLAVLYLLPTLIGLARGVDALALVFLVNLIGAPTGIGWAAALILAFGPRRLPPEHLWPRQQAYQDAGAWMRDLPGRR